VIERSVAFSQFFQMALNIQATAAEKDLMVRIERTGKPFIVN
jgi:hypothetical protein